MMIIKITKVYFPVLNDKVHKDKNIIMDRPLCQKFQQTNKQTSKHTKKEQTNKQTN